MPRLAAALVALAAWAGLAIQFSATFAGNGGVVETLWILARYFTVLTNLLVAFTFTGLALGRRFSQSWLGGVTLAIVLVGIVYMTLLRGLLELSGGALLADTVLHNVVPILVPLWWLAFAPKGRLQWSAPLLWALYPLAYFVYALVRGLGEDRYAYPFLDVSDLGYVQVAINGALIAGGFVAVGYLLVWLDRRLLGRGSPLSKARA